MLIKHRVYLISASLIVVLVALGATVPKRFAAAAEYILEQLSYYFGWFYLLSVFVFVVFLLALAFSRYGKTRLGPQDSSPEYGVFSWLSMLLSAGFGVGLVFYGMAEPILHLGEPPHGAAEAGSPAAASLAIQYSFFHWGVSQWAAFTLVGLIIAFFQFRKDRPGLVSTMVEPAIRDVPRRHLVAESLDVLAVIATVMGVATSLGLGVLQMNGGLEKVFGWPDTFWTKAAILAAMFVCYMASSYSGLDRGIKMLSNLNMGLCLGFMGYMLVTGPTVLILDTFVHGLGNYLGNFISMSLTSPPFEKGDWMNRYTVFYWAWVIAWSPFVGTFVARISRGRTIQEYILGVLLVPPLLACAWIAVFGGTALDMELNGGAGLTSVVSENVPSGLFEMYALLPYSDWLSGITMVILFVFLVTSADSAAYIVSQMTDQGSLNPPLYKRLTWGVLISAICITLIAASGLRGLQSASLLSALPFALVLFLMIGVLIKELREDRRETLMALYHRNDGTPVGADLFEADEFSELPPEERVRRRLTVVNRNSPD
ncbi:BCCT family transporter [Alloalcanivorax mobilis]|uniref:BCCT family transporter n=1 Tax=Alloalcanivorax mobilis TaxID=2019569 RepID=UPI000B5B1FCC|nr:BCCT family transporter [Alloalcanivorax mobilis]ASK33400.1 glycine/betaine ABC transporter permease [Alcanivorax sp. N3-2A]|tara:strand:+ start:11194 stop:12819 length:1626 start_codon:yes stop_codon:yes gene_type:complete